jgi:hypothetical protein
MHYKSHLDRVAFAVASMLALVAAFFFARWYGLGWAVMAKPFALPLFIGMFWMAVGFPAYYVVRYIRRAKA